MHDTQIIEYGSDYYRRQLEAVSKNATLAVFIMDEQQRCVFMNPAAENLTGYKMNEVSDKPLHDYVHNKRPDGSHYPLEECPIDRVFPQNFQEQGEELFVHKDGSFYPVAFTASPVREGDVTVGTIIEVRGIAEERKAQQEFKNCLKPNAPRARKAKSSGASVRLFPPNSICTKSFKPYRRRDRT